MSNPEDIMNFGPEGLKGLSSVSQRENAFNSLSDEERDMLMSSLQPYTKEQAHNKKIMNLGNVDTYATGQNLGSSKYDRPVYNLEEIEDVQDLRAQEQSSASKLGAGFVKFGTTAVTTFLDSTLGMMVGFGQGIANITDDDPKTSFREGLWNNQFNKAMASLQEDMERWVPNYYTKAEMEAPWYKNLGTANFWGDKFLKNMGFTVGAMASMAVPGINMSWVPRATMGAAKALGAGYSGLKAANKAGKVATQALRTVISANGEANIEAINAVKDNYNLEIGNLNQKRNTAINEAKRWYSEHQFDLNPEGPSSYDIYMNRLAKIDSEYDAAKKEIENGIVNVGNSVHVANMLVLSLTNTLEFGNYLKGGYNLQKGMKNLKMLANGEETASMKEFAKAATQGKAALATNSMSAAERAGRVTMGSISRAASEGFEEGAQRLSSDTEQMKEQARINKWAKETKNTFYGDGVNPDVAEELSDRFKALHHAWNTSFGDISSTGWEEVFLGALTGGIGTFNLRQSRQGKIGIGWQGGIGEAIRDIKEEEQDATKYIEMFNKRIQSEDFRKRYNHALTAMSLTDKMDNFLNLGKVLEYKNSEMLKIVNDAYFFKDMNAIDFFKAFYEEAANGLSEEDVALVREELKSINENISPFGSMTNAEIAETLQDKAKSTLQKIDKTLELYDYLNLKYQDKAFEAASNVLKDDSSFYGGPAAMTEVLLREVASEASVIWDMERRKSELQNQIDTMDAGTKAIRGTKYEEHGIAELDREINRRKAIYDNNLSDFNSLAKTIKRVNDLAIRRATLKDNKKYKEAFKNATNLQEIADLYFSIDDSTDSKTLDSDTLNNRQIVFEDALNEAEGETKELLESFKPFLASVNAIDDIMSDVVDSNIKFPEDGPSPTLDDIAALDSLREDAKNALRQEIQYSIRSYIEDSRSPYDKGSLADTLKERVKVYSQLADSESDPEEAEGYKNMANTLKDIADELDRIEVIYQAADRGEDSEDVEDEGEEANGSEDTSDENGGGDENTDDIDDDAESSKDSGKEGKKEDKKSPTPETSIVTDKDAAKAYANRRLKKTLGDDYDRFVNIIEQDDPSQEDRDWFNSILNNKKRSFNTFIGRFVREFKEDSEEGGTDSGITIFDDKEKKDKEISTISDTSVRTNPYRPYLQGSGMNDEEEVDSDDTRSDDEIKKAVEESKKRPGIINGIGVLALENAVNTKYYENWYKNKFFAPIAQGIDYITNNLLWELMQTGTDGKLKVLYTEFYPKDGSRQVVFRGFKKSHIMLVTPYNSKIEGVINKSGAKDTVKNNIIETIDKNGKAQKYLIVGAYGYSSGNKALAEGHSIIDKAISDQRQSSNVRNEWEVLEEGENGKYVNYIYDVSPGYALRQYDENDTGNRSLKDLLEHSNPHHQEPKDIRVSYWTGDEESRRGIEMKWANKKSGDRFYDEKFVHEPGQVVVWMPTADGKFFPQHVSPIAFKELREGVNGQVYADIMNLIRTIANNRTNKKEVKKAIAALRGTDEIPGMLVLSSRKNKGTRIEYSENEGVIVFVKDGVNLVDENIYLEREGTTAESVIKQLTEMLGDGHKTGDEEQTNGLNALVAIHGHILATRPDYYINSNVLNVNLRQWGTVNARGYAYPVRPDGTIDSLYVPQPAKTAGRTTEDPFREPTWFNGHKFVYDTATGVVRDENNKEVTNREILDQINDIRTIKESRMKPIVDEGSKYFIVGGKVYYSPRRNSYVRVEGERLSAIKKKAAVQEALNEQREITHTKEEIEKEIDRLQHKIDTVTVSNREVAAFEPHTLEELVAETLHAYIPGNFNAESFLKEGLDPIVIKKFSKGPNKFFGKDGTISFSDIVDLIYHEAVELGFIGDDDWNIVRDEVYNSLDVSVLGTSYASVKGRIAEQIRSFISERKVLDYRLQISMLSEELDAIIQREEKNPKPQEEEEDIPFEALSKEEQEKEIQKTISEFKITVSKERLNRVSKETKFEEYLSAIKSSWKWLVDGSQDRGSYYTGLPVQMQLHSAFLAAIELGLIPNLEGADFKNNKIQKTVMDTWINMLQSYGISNPSQIFPYVESLVNGKKEQPNQSIQSQIVEEQSEEQEKLQRQERITTFGRLYESLIDDFVSDEELLDLSDRVFEKIGADGALDAAGKIYDSTKTRALLLKVSDKDSLIALLRKIDECGI